MNELNKKVLSMPANELAQLYKTLFETPVGKLVLADLSHRCYIHASSAWPDADGPVNDMLTTYKNEGMRAVYLYIENQINQEPEEQPKTEEQAQ